MHNQGEQEKIENINAIGGHQQHDYRHYAEDAAPVDRHDEQDKTGTAAGAELLWSQVRHYLREPFSEFLGTFILILFGDGGVAQVVLSDGKKGDYQSISWAWG